MSAAREKVRVAHALADLPRISLSFSQGKISYSKVRAMTRVATAEKEGLLLTRLILHPFYCDAARPCICGFSLGRENPHLPGLATSRHERVVNKVGLMIALHGTASHVERAVRQFKRAKRKEAQDAENERHPCRHVVWRMDEYGS